MNQILIVLALFFVFTSGAAARQLSLKDHGPAGFLRVTGGQQASGDNLYASSSGSQTLFTEEVDYNLGGELGFIYNFSEKFGVRIGVDLVQTKNSTVTGKDSGGDTLMTVDTGSFAFNPNMGFEYAIANNGWLKTVFFSSLGYATVKVKNEYSITNPDGTTAYPAVPTSFKETVEGNGLLWQAGLGWEIVTVDNVSTLIELGYREVKVDELEYSSATTLFDGTSKAAGATALNNDGSKRSAKIGGPFVGISFRFRFPAFL